MHYSAAIDLIDDSATYYTNLAAAHVALKDWPNAIKMAHKARKAYEEGLFLLPDSQQMLDGRQAVTADLRAGEEAEATALVRIRAMQGEKAAREAATAASKTANKAASPASSPARQGGLVGGGSPAGRSSPGGTGAADLKKALRSLRKDPAALYKILAGLDPAGLRGGLKSGLEEEELVA
ncbi:hypothetical protein T484DRAFT_1768985, partial [Baffinella frigidus]